MNLRKKFTADAVGERTSKTMSKLIESLEKNFHDIDAAWECQLEMIAMNYQLMYEAYDDLCDQGKLQRDSRGRLQKNPSIAIFQNTQANIQNIMNKMGWSVLSKARAKALMDTEVEKDEFERAFG